MSGRLQDKVALVVGAGSIAEGWSNGKAASVLFAREGARVFAADINLAAAEETAAIIRGEGGDATAHAADATNAAQIKAMVAACLDAYGRIDVLHNNVFDNRGLVDQHLFRVHLIRRRRSHDALLKEI